MKTLQITEKKAFAMLGPTAERYLAHGYESDGPAWLPSEPVGPDDPGVGQVLEAGLGVMVSAIWCQGDAAAAVFLDLVADLASCRELGDHEAWINAVTDKAASLGIGWSHFGNWLFEDSEFVFMLPD